jgi:disulfide bond formation protein DsbB
MDPVTTFITKAGALFVLIAHIGLVFVVLGFLFEGKNFWLRISPFFIHYSLHFAWLLAFGAMILSLYYSEIAGILPCKLCWFQRIFMYSLVVVLGVGIFIKERSVYWIGMILASVGALVGIYHHVIQVMPTMSVLPCATPSALEPSCTQVLFIEYGYITFPMFALTIFALIIVALLAYRQELPR